MIFQHDTRDKRGKHDNVDTVLEGMGHSIVRSKMYVGDITLLNNQSVCIDLKQGLGEVESNLVHQHNRFRAECIRAQEAGIRLVILVEDDRIDSVYAVHDWQNPRYKRWMRLRNAHAQGKMLYVDIPKVPPITGKRLQTMMETMAAKYGIEWVLCKHDDVADRICKILGVETDGRQKESTGSIPNGVRLSPEVDAEDSVLG